MTTSLLAPTPASTAGSPGALSVRLAAPDAPRLATLPSGGAATQPLYAELASSLVRLIEQDTLRPGHRVPSV